MPVWSMILVMALVTYLIRALPFVFVRGKIKSRFARSLLYYMPYAVLSAMTVPAIFSSTASLVGAVAGTAAAVVSALFKRSLLFVAIAACLFAFLAQTLTGLL